ncbi:MAG: hypothetical protein PHT36_01085 [Patescibacteria group bacterium]|nr:hypothetical protein [Patescibacteria group bacterium]
MRSKILTTAITLLFIAVPSASVAEPTYKVKETKNDLEIVQSIKTVIEANLYKTKDEIAAEEIKKYVKRLEDQKKKAEIKKVVSTKKKTVRIASTNSTNVPDSSACVVAMKKVFPKNLWRIGYAIMRAESGARPNAIGGPNYNGTYDYGCWQINNTPRALDPDVGAKIAWYKYNHSGWYPWTVYKTGAYLRFF